MIRVSPNDMATIADAFKQGKVIVFPTETSYGIGCDATNEAAVARVIAIKQRRPDKGLPVLTHSLQEARKHILFNERAMDLAHRHWPGPLNIISEVLPGSAIVTLCHKDGMQALRHSSSPFVTDLMKHIDFPIVATSANIAGEVSAYDADQVWAQFEPEVDQPDLVVDGGVLPQTPASTMVRVTGSYIDVVRFGGIAV